MDFATAIAHIKKLTVTQAPSSTFAMHGVTDSGSVSVVVIQRILPCP